MNTIKKITLRPLDKFFFGGENFFDADDGVFYFQKSRDFPQQTTLLGLMRHQILLQNGLMDSKGKIDPTKNADTWIGKQSFDVNVSNFGKIKRLSPTFITKNGVELQPNWGAKQKNKSVDDFNFGNTFKASFHGEVEQDITLISNYTEKQGIEYGFKNSEGKTFNYGEVYCDKEAPQIGIDKQSRTKKGPNGETMSDDDAKGFYKFKYCRLNKDFAFAFYIEIDEGVKLNDTIITMGKERCAFGMKVEDGNPPFTMPQRPSLQAGSKIVLLSDTYVNSEIYDHCDLIISDTISFKNMKTNTSTANYADKPSWSDRLNLLKRGTVLQLSKSANPKKVQTLLDQAHFQKIGYNYYTNY